MTSPTVTATPADPESTSALISPQRRNFIFVAVLLGMLLAALDQTIVATALPTVVADLGGAGHQSWVVTSYLLASTIATAIVGKLGDLFGRKAVFQVSVVFFLAGSVLCGLSSIDDDAGGVACPAGHRRRRHHGDRNGTDRRGDPAAGSRPVSGCARRRVRCHDGGRATAGRVLHRPPDVALGLLDQRSGRGGGVHRGGRRHPGTGPQRPPDHRLRGHRVRRPGRVRPDAGHQLGRRYLRLDLAGDHRSVRRLGVGPERLRLGGNPCGRTDPADPAVPQPGIHRLLRAVVHRRFRDAGRADLPAHVHAVRRRSIGDGVGPADAADGGRTAVDVDGQWRDRRAAPAGTRSSRSSAPP